MFLEKSTISSRNADGPRKLLKQKRLGFIILFTFLILLDQFIKQKIKICTTKEALNICVIKNFLSITYTKNFGVALGIFSKVNKYVLISTTIILIVSLILYFLKKYSKIKTLQLVAFVLVIAGSTSNLMDRLLFGYVIDYINISFFPPIFNLADVYIMLGVALSLKQILNKK